MIGDVAHAHDQLKQPVDLNLLIVARHRWRWFDAFVGELPVWLQVVVWAIVLLLIARTIRNYWRGTVRFSETLYATRSTARARGILMMLAAPLFAVLACNAGE